MKRILIVCGCVVLVIGCAGTAAFLVVYQSARIDTVGEVEFDRTLAIPPLAEPTVSGGERVFNLTLQQGSHHFGRGQTATWGIDGGYLGPTVRAKRGERVRFAIDNELGEATSMHWHGMHVPARMDGGPHQMIEPGDTWKPHWMIDQPAATLWYHPHLHGSTARHVYNGLAGMFIIDDDDTPAALPQDYGVDDIPLIVQDKSFDDDGQLDDSGRLLSNVGVLGDTIAVNGTVSPYLDVTHEATRLRILNGSNARVYNFTFDDERAFDLVATDGGLVESPVALTHLQLSPGERAEMVVRMEPGERTVLRSGPTERPNRFAGGDDRFDILEFRAADRLTSSPELPARLAQVTPIDPADAQRTRTFAMAGTSINGQDMDMSRIDETVIAGDTEIWEVTNRDGNVHNFHVHDVQFQVLEIAGRRPGPQQRGWKDTVLLPPNETVRIIMRFGDYTDPTWPYMFHCHLLRHEDRGMMGQFVVVKPD